MAEIFTVALVIVGLIALTSLIACGWQIVEIEVSMRKAQPQPEQQKPEPFRYVGHTSDGFAIYE